MKFKLLLLASLLVYSCNNSDNELKNDANNEEEYGTDYYGD